MQRRTLLKAFALSASVVAMGLSFSVQAADTIKVGIMHSLSGTMAISAWCEPCGESTIARNTFPMPYSVF